MKRNLFAIFAVLLVVLLASFTVQAKDTDKKAEKEAVKAEKSMDTAEEKAEAAKEEAATEGTEAKEPEAKAEAPQFPVDPNKIKVTVKYKNGKTVNGVVKHFLASENLTDHVGEITWTLSDGPVVMHGMDEFSMAWNDIGKIEFNKKNKENGEISCYEVSDVSPDRMECLMINEYVLTPKDKKKIDKEPFVVQSREMFRFVIDTGKGLHNADTHLGKVKITNERDESRKMKDMSKELIDVYGNSILWINFQ